MHGYAAIGFLVNTYNRSEDCFKSLIVETLSAEGKWLNHVIKRMGTPQLTQAVRETAPRLQSNPFVSDIEHACHLMDGFRSIRNAYAHNILYFDLDEDGHYFSHVTVHNIPDQNRPNLKEVKLGPDALSRACLLAEQTLGWMMELEMCVLEIRIGGSLEGPRARPPLWPSLTELDLMAPDGKP
ncbi:hypothetical protein [Sphingopyxis chilensis]